MIIVGDSILNISKMLQYGSLSQLQHSTASSDLPDHPFWLYLIRMFAQWFAAATAATNSLATPPTTYLTIWSLILGFFTLASFSMRRLTFTFTLLAHIQLLTKHSGILPSCRWHTFYTALRPSTGFSPPPYMRLFFFNRKKLEQVVSVLHQSQSRLKLCSYRPKFQQHYIWHNEALQTRWGEKRQNRQIGFLYFHSLVGVTTTKKVTLRRVCEAFTTLIQS